MIRVKQIITGFTSPICTANMQICAHTLLVMFHLLKCNDTELILLLQHELPYLAPDEMHHCMRLVSVYECNM